MKKLIWFAMLLMCFFVGLKKSEAQEIDYTGSAGLYVGYHFYNHDRPYKDRSEFGFMLEKYLGDRLGLELDVGYVSTRRKSDDINLNLMTHSINLNIYAKAIKELFSPYLTFGVAGDTTGIGVSHVEKKMLIGPDLGAGIKVNVMERLAMRLEVRDTYYFKKRNDVIPALKISYLFGKKRLPPPPPPPPVDSDDDGISDSLDKCPDTPSGVKVDSNGCPVDSDNDGVADYLDKCPDTSAGIKVDNKGCPVDSDSDGVADSLDKCPDTPSKVEVDNKGCPLDSDNDGVADHLDKCPNTPRGGEVDANGCAKDSDSDGVPDYLDKCPKTPPNVTVDKNGCPLLDSDNDGVPDSLDKCPNTPPKAVVDNKGCPTDSDNDGVSDYLDKCPSTPPNTKVDEKGCPADSDNDGVADYQDKCPSTPPNVKVDEKGCPADSDNDGVADYLDKCPNTPSDVKVDEKGCPKDSDNDGVADYLDKCPKSPPGSKVDVNGCVVSISIDILFDSGKSVVNEVYYPEIEKLARFLEDYPDVKVEIQGHTDNVGKAEDNKILSDKRVNALRDVLVTKYGISTGRVTARGYGEEKPIASNDTPEGKKMNRRVEAVIIK